MAIKREVKLAVTAIIAVLILIWGINFLKGLSLFENRVVYHAVYDRVDGLKVSSGVVYRGYQVGQVLSICFVGDRQEQVLVKFSVTDNLSLPANTSAMIQSDDLMGTKVINLIPGDSPLPARRNDTLRSRIEQGLMEQVSSQLFPLKQKAESLIYSVDSVMTILQGLFDERTKQSLANSFQSIDRTLNHLESASVSLDTMMQNEVTTIGQILANLNSITGNLYGNNDRISAILENLSGITDSLRQANLKQTLIAFGEVLEEAESILARAGQGEGTLGALLNDDRLYNQLSYSMENLNKLLLEFRSNPKRFIRLSLIDFSSGGTKLEPYGVVISETAEPLPRNADIYVQYPDLREVKVDGKYLYIVESFQKLNQAQRKLKSVIKSYENAFIVKIDFL